MEKKVISALGIGAITLAAAALFPIIGTMFGTLSGWAVGLFFGNTIDAFTTAAGLDVEPWQLGGFLGFVSGFFTTVTRAKS